jgi:uncharacterized protein (DUF2336 family)
MRAASCGWRADPAADQVEGRADVVDREEIQKLRRQRRVRTVVEGQRDQRLFVAIRVTVACIPW